MTAAELAEVFRTEERVRILRHVVEQGPVTATAIVRAEGVSEALVSRHLRRLEDGGISRDRAGPMSGWTMQGGAR